VASEVRGGIRDHRWPQGVSGGLSGSLLASGDCWWSRGLQVASGDLGWSLGLGLISGSQGWYHVVVAGLEGLRWPLGIMGGPGGEICPWGRSSPHGFAGGLGRSQVASGVTSGLGSHEWPWEVMGGLGGSRLA
jgi:hypothetical protein